MAVTESATNPLTDALFDEPGIGRCLLAPDATILRANAEWLRSTGFALDDVLGANILELFPDSRDVALAMHARARAGHRIEVPPHAQVINGRETWWEGSVAPIPMENGTGLLILAREVTPHVERRAAEEAPRGATGAAAAPRAEPILEAFFANSPGIVNLLDGELRYLNTDRSTPRYFGLDRETIVGMPLHDLAPGFVERFGPALKRVVETGEPALNLETFAQLPNPPGEVQRWRSSYFRVPLADGRHGLGVVGVEITDLKRAEEALRASEARLQALLDTVPAAVWIAHDPLASQITTNRFGAALLRAPPGSNVSVTAPSDERPTNFRPMKDGKEIPPDELPLQAAARHGREFRDFEFDLVFDDGTVRHLLGSSSPVLDATGSAGGAVGAFIDITHRKQAEARSESLARFPEENPHPVLRLDAALAVLYANPAALTGLADLGLALHRPAPAPIGEAARRAVAGGRRVGAELRCGDAVFSATFVPVGDEVNVYAHDVTARQHAEDALRASEEELRALVMASSDVLYRMSPDWREMRQLRSGHFVANTDAPTTAWQQKYIHPDDRAKVDAAIQHAIRTGSAFELEHRVLRADGTTGWTFSRAVPLKDGSGAIVEWFGAATDVTDRKRAEEALREANAHLREADRRKMEFLAILSHELRNPLAPIRNGIHILERAVPGSAQAARAKEVVRRQTEHLTRLVDDLLDVMRMEHGKVSLQRSRLDFREIVRAATDDLRSVFANAGVELHVEHVLGPVWIDADATRLAQAVGNLLHNAAKFTPRGGAVAVALRSDERRAELRVRDTGVGIDAAMMARLFVPFVQAEQTLARTSGGLGLGLALVKGLVGLHGGAVEARSDGLGRGAEFVIQLPLADADGPARAPHVQGLREKGRLILVVEDNVDAAETLADLLRLEGHRVRVAHDGRSGLALAREIRPDVVLCDIGLPDVDGYEVARTLRSDEAFRATRLVALTGYAQPEDRQRARDAGFDAHIAKPPDSAELADALA